MLAFATSFSGPLSTRFSPKYVLLAAQGLLVRRDDVLRTARVLQPGVLGADAGVIEAGTDGVRLDDLTCARLQDVRADTVEHAGDALAKRSGVVITIKACKGMENERGLTHE